MTIDDQTTVVSPAWTSPSNGSVARRSSTTTRSARPCHQWIRSAAGGSCATADPPDELLTSFADVYGRAPELVADDDRLDRIRAMGLLA